jgi:hypothetical protein
MAAEELIARIEAMRDRLAPQFPDIDPGDLLLIIKALLRPPGSRRRFFIRKLGPGRYVV